MAHCDGMAVADADGVCPDGHTGRVCDLHFDAFEKEGDDDLSYYGNYDDGGTTGDDYYDDDASSTALFTNNSYGFGHSIVQSLCHIEVCPSCL